MPVPILCERRSEEPGGHPDVDVMTGEDGTFPGLDTFTFKFVRVIGRLFVIGGDGTESRSNELLLLLPLLLQFLLEKL